MAVNKFEDQLFDDLMREYGPALQRIDRPAVAGRGIVARPVWRAAGVLAVLAAAALAVTTLVPSSHRGSHQATVRLAAWTVTKQADGSIDVTVRQWRDPARLQATLRAEGVPAVVTPPPNPACRPYHAKRALLSTVARFRTPALSPANRIVLVIHPSAIPSGAGLSISIAPAMHQPPPGMKRVPRAVPPVPVGLVYASRECTGNALGAAAPVEASPFVYVANHGGNDVSQFAAPLSRMEALQPLTPATVATGRYPEAMAVSPDGHSAYIANVDNNTIGQYTINPATGTLRPKSPATMPTGSGANGVAVSPDGKNAYVAVASGNTVSQYSIDLATGKLSPKSPPTVPAGHAPAGIAVSPDGKNLYVVGGGCNDKPPPCRDNHGTVLQYSIDPATGKLLPKSPATVPTGHTPGAVAVTPDGRSAYVTEALHGTVLQYSVDPATGKLLPNSPATVPGGPGAVVVGPDGKSAYVADGNGTIWQYSINPTTGKLSPKSPGTVATGHQVEAIVISPDGKSAYLPSETASKVWQYSIDPASGKLSPKSPATVAAGLGSAALAVTPDADVSVRITAPASVASGSGLTYTIKISNAGPSSAWRVMLTDHLPYATRFLKASATGGRCFGTRAGARGATVRCHLGMINSGSSRTARIHVKVTVTSSQRVIINAAKDKGVTPDPRRNNNTATAQTKITN
jgi:uncharacterized repeat protein (TIGR01451 family)